MCILVRCAFWIHRRLPLPLLVHCAPNPYRSAKLSAKFFSYALLSAEGMVMPIAAVHVPFFADL